jgi:integrase
MLIERTTEGPQMSKLTVKKVQSLSEPGKYGDGQNLWLIIGPTGRKRWEFRYTVAGKSREMGLGALEFMSLDEARNKAFELRRMVKQGMDPLSAKETKRKLRDTGFEQVTEQCIASLKAGWSNAKSEAQWRSSLKAYAFPQLGMLDVAAITTADVFEVLEPIWSAKPETAKRVRERIEKVLDFASALKLRTGENPARWRGGLEPLFPKKAKVQKVRHHPALPYAEMSDFMKLLRAKEGIAPRALEFAILTAARTNEVLGATWSEIDMEKAVWVIPAERMKARRDHRVPLSEAALELLRALPRDTDGEFLFMSTMSRGKPLSNMAMLKTLKLMKRTDLTVHGFRSTFRDWAAETTSYPDAVVEMALAHAVGNAVEAAYRRGDLFEKRKRLMADWASFSRSDSRTGAKVVPIRA